MKTIRTAMLSIVFALSAYVSNSQEQKVPVNEPDYNKPRLFTNLPDKIPVSISNIDNIVMAPLGRSSSFRLSEDNSLEFAGEVVSTATKYNNSIQSVVIRSETFNGARLTISKITNSDGSIRYTGRIISFKHGDLYELESHEGQLVLVRKNYHELVNE